MQRIVINPDVFIWTEDSNGIIYDSKVCHGFLFHKTTALSSLIEELQEPNNLYSVQLSNLDIPDVKRFLDRIVAEGYAKFIDDQDSNILSMKPILRIQDNVNYYRWLHKQGIDGEVINNIRKIIINIGEEIGCDLFASQVPYPVYSSNLNLCTQKLLKFIKASNKSLFLSEINIIGNPIGQLDIKFLKEIKNVAPIKFSVLGENINQDSINKLFDLGKVEVVTRVSTISSRIINLINNNPELDLCFLVEENDDILTLESLPINDTSFEKIYILPLYNTHNLEFLSGALSITENELLNNGPDKRNIFIHQSINLFDFGKIYIMPDGTIRTNMCSKSIGSLDDTPYSIVYTEFDNGKSWLKTRNSQPCKYCVFKSLCPSPSNYETIVGYPLCFKTKYR